MVTQVKRLFAGIPWRNFTNNDLAEAEGYYASVLYAFFVSLDAIISPEDKGNHGQVDLTIKLGDYTYVIEVKAEDNPAAASELGSNPALAQIRDKGYSDKYRDEPGRKLFEVGLVFSRKERNLVHADWHEVLSEEQ